MANLSRNADFSKSSLIGSNLESAKLYNTNFNDTDLTNVNFIRAFVGKISLVNAKLDGTKGLDGQGSKNIE